RAICAIADQTYNITIRSKNFYNLEQYWHPQFKAFNILSSKFLNSLTTSILSNHKIELKDGTLIMLFRNLDQYGGKIYIFLECQSLHPNLHDLLSLSEDSLYVFSMLWQSINLKINHKKMYDYIYLNQCSIMINCM
ncbi:hypothetical protein Lal_00005956, partial [Lupinus albus]